MKPLISYYGGKQRLAPKIVPLLPKHTVYVEPFCGGAAVFFSKPWPPVTNSHHYREVLNDLDGRLINLYRVIRHPDLGPELISRLECTLYSRDEHYLSKKVLTTNNKWSNIDLAWAYYVNIQQSFANKLLSGWGTGVYGRNLAFTWINKISHLRDYIARLKSVHIEHDDALNVIRRWDSPQTLFFCDPPYPGSDQGHYNGYTSDDFASLIETLNTCQGSFVLSNYKQPGIPEHWERFEFSSYCSASSKGRSGKNRDKARSATKAELGNVKRTEMVWRMDRSANARPEIQKIWGKWYGNNENKNMLLW